MNPSIPTRTAMLLTGLLLAPLAQAFDMGRMMNPSKWMGGNSDNREEGYRNDHPGGPGGYGPPPGYAGQAPYGVPPQGYYGAPPQGYGYGHPGQLAPPAGAQGLPPATGLPQGYGATPPAQPGYAPPPADATAEEIRQLKERIRQLEERTQRGY